MSIFDGSRCELIGRVRRAGKSDARAIAELFQRTYEDSSHECKEVEYVRQTLLGDDHTWIVCEDGDEIVSVTCCRRSGWNHSYETCYSITKRHVRGQGLAKRLFVTALDVAYRRGDCEIVVGYPRSQTMFQLTTSGFASPPVAVGYDGGINVANGQREYHLITMARNARANPIRVAPRIDAFQWLDSVRRPVLASLGFASEPGEYPLAIVAGSGLGHEATIHGFRFSYLHDPTSPSGAVQVTGLSRQGSFATSPEKAFTSFVSKFASMPYIGVQVLVDKRPVIDLLQEIGFTITAYLPAWYPKGGRRFDCLMLVKSRFSAQPISHGLESVIDGFRGTFEQRPAPEPLAASVHRATVAA